MSKIFVLPPFSGMSPELHLTLAQRATLRSMTRGTRAFGPGGPAAALLIMVAGTLRVDHGNSAGADTLLYRVNGATDSGVAPACLLPRFDDDRTTGMAETDLRLLALPGTDFDDLMTTSAEFRSLIYRTYALRIGHLVSALQVDTGRGPSTRPVAGTQSKRSRRLARPARHQRSGRM